MSEVVIAEFMDEAAVARVANRFATRYDPALVDNAEALHTAIADARALIVRNRTQVRGFLLEQAAKLECVGRLGVGLDNIDLEACRSRGIAVYPATGANNLAVAEYVLAMALMLLRGAYVSSADVAAGQWPRQAMIGRELSGKIMGLVGYGAIAREVALRARACGMRVAAHDPYVDAGDAAWRNIERLSLEALLDTADVVSLHVPLTDGTRRLIDTAALRRMKKGAVLVNAARGGVVDEAALAAALREGRIGGAALDVFENEPLTAQAGAKFAGIANLVLTPHIAGVTEEANIRVSGVIAEAVIRHLEKQA